MSVRWPVGLAVCLPLGVAPTLVSAQTATPHSVTTISLPPAATRFQHHKVLRAAYDSVADWTHLSVVTHKGRYFLTVQRPRLTWSVIYGGRTATAAPAEVILEFRTQAPQVAADSRLQIEYGSGQRHEVASAGAHSGWRLKDDGETVTLSPGDADAALQITSFTKGTGPIGDAELADLAQRGAPADTSRKPVTCGDFQGYRAAYLEDEVSWRVWWLARGGTHLYITYNTAPVHRDRHGAIVDWILGTLRAAAAV